MILGFHEQRVLKMLFHKCFILTTHFKILHFEDVKFELKDLSALGQLTRLDQNYAERSAQCQATSSVFSPSLHLFSGAVLLKVRRVNRPIEACWELQSWFLSLGNHSSSPAGVGWCCGQMLGDFHPLQTAYSPECILSTFWKNLPPHRLFYVKFWGERRSAGDL